jgi:hypothetical protein
MLPLDFLGSGMTDSQLSKSDKSNYISASYYNATNKRPCSTPATVIQPRLINAIKVGSTKSLMNRVQTAFQLRVLRHYRKMILQRAAEVLIFKSGGDCPIWLKIYRTGSVS